MRTGDGSHKRHSHGKQYWGYGDVDMTDEDINDVTILRKAK